MNDSDAMNPDEMDSARSLPGAPLGSQAAPSSDGADAPLTPPSDSSRHRPTSVPTAQRERWLWVQRLLSNKRRRWVAAAAVLAAVLGLSLGLTTSHPASANQLVSNSHAAASRFGGAGSNARSAPSAGGASGTVNSVSTSSFTMTTSVGQKVTVDESFSTTYLKKSRTAAANAIAKGESVLALGTTSGSASGTTIKATQVIVQATGSGSTASSPTKVVPFQPGAPTTSKQAGHIPANWSQGSGTIVSGTPANKATEAALAAYPGGVVDRVVKLSNGEYNVHIIGVNWPHHIFVNQNFKVVGAE